MSALSIRLMKLETRRAGHRETIPAHEAKRILAEVTNSELAAAVIDHGADLAERLVQHTLTAEERKGVHRLAAIVPDPEGYLLRLARRDGR